MSALRQQPTLRFRSRAVAALLPVLLLLASITGMPTHTRAQDEAGSSSPSFKDFQLVINRNIFDSERSPRRTEPRQAPTPKPVPVERIALLGTLIGEGQCVAFVKGAGNRDFGAVHVGDTIQDFKVTGISTEGLRLQENDRALALPVGSALLRRGDDPWRVAAGDEARDADSSDDSSRKRTTTKPSSPGSESGSADDDVLQRLMARRQQETER